MVEWARSVPCRQERQLASSLRCRSARTMPYLSFHGKKGNLVIGEGRDTKLPLEDVAEQLEGDCKGRVVHLGTAVPSVYTVAN